MLKQAIKKDEFKRILWVRGDGQHLPFRENLFNCIYMTSVIHHIENKEKAIREMHRALKPNSRCVIMTYSQTRLRKHTIHHFPGIVAIDLKRIPPIPLLKRIMTETGFKGVTYHVAKHDEGYVPIDAYLERVRNKYISTLTLLSEDNFQRGFKIFEKRIRRKYLDRIRRISWFVFVVGQK
jgi:ubiquinone/menaquinone biosynthesis C-methylase UbiE